MALEQISKSQNQKSEIRNQKFLFLPIFSTSPIPAFLSPVKPFIFACHVKSHYRNSINATAPGH